MDNQLLKQLYQKYQKEIAALLRKTPENIRILAYRGKIELREYMEANGYDLS